MTNPGASQPVLGWSVALGFAIGGFFDGVLLHQILQWHHLLSLVRSVGTLRAQVLWDGYFHAIMYVLAIGAGIMLWRRRKELVGSSGGRFVGALLIGLYLLRGKGQGGKGQGGKPRPGVMLGGIALAMALGGWSLRAPPGPQLTTIVFAPHVTPAEAMEAIVAEGGRIVAADSAATVIVADFAAGAGHARAFDLYRRGALLVSGSGSPAGCAGWSKV